MGSACCVAAKDATTPEGVNGDILRRTIQYSPSWGVRWDNRGRVAGEEVPATVLNNRGRRNGRWENKSEPFFDTVPEVTSSEESPRKPSLVRRNISTQVKSHVSESLEGHSISMEVKEVMDLPAAPTHTLSTLPPDMSSASHIPTSQLSSGSHLVSASSVPSKQSLRVPKSHLFCQGSDSWICRPKSPSRNSISEDRSCPLLPSLCNESAQDSHGGSVDGWSLQSFPESSVSTHKETWSFDSDSLGSVCHKQAQSSSRKPDFHSNELKTCVVCSKYLVEKSLFSSQKIVPNNELSVVAILACRHVYHADCLEHLTPEISKYDPSCPVCTFGEQQAQEMFEKLLKADMDLKFKNKKLRKRVVSSDFIPSSHFNSPKLESSSSLRSSFSKPFLKRHFSFGAKGSSSSQPDDHVARKRSFLWSKSSK